MDKLISSIKDQISQASQPEKTSGRSRMLGKDFKTTHTPVPQVREIVYQVSERYQEDIDHLAAAQKLLSSPAYEYQLAGIFLLANRPTKSDKLNIPLIQNLITTYIDEWSLCDTLAAEVTAPYLIDHWSQKEILLDWAQSDNSWLKRSVIVTTIKSKDKVPRWSQFSARLLDNLKGEQEEIVDKAIAWLQREK